MGKLGVRETLRFSLVMVLLAVALFSGILSGVAAQDGQNMSAEEKSKIRSFFLFSPFFHKAHDLVFSSTVFNSFLIKAWGLKKRSTLNKNNYTYIEKYVK